MNELQAWRDWAANILGVYIGVDPALVADIKIGNGDVAARAYLSYYAGVGLGQLALDCAQTLKKAGDA